MAEILDGKAISEKIISRIKQETSKLNIKPGLAAILVGDDAPSKMYVAMKQKACEQAGFKSTLTKLPSDISEEKLFNEIETLNQDETIHGILVQLPLPTHISQQKVFNSIAPEKDVDGFHPLNMGELMAKNESLVAATPRGVIMLLEEYGIRTKGKEVVIVNHSTLVGKPLAMLFLNRQATVTVCHVNTKNLKIHTRKADILISATGVPHLITEDMVAEGAVVVDVGISQKDGKTVGDVDFEKVSDKCSYISPVPGGVGPMTIAALLENTLQAAKTKAQ